jgi:ribose/xylose/arabinose/galactoside ABC-type transport system permease subunit
MAGVFMSSKTKDYIIIIRVLKTLAFPFVVCLFFGFATGGKIFSLRTIRVILRQSVLPAIIIMAMLPNLSLGMIDFSVGAVVTTSAIIAGNLMNMTGTGLAGLIIFALLSSVILASLTGFLNNKLKVPTLALALGLTLVYEALPFVLFPAKNSAIIKVKYAVLSQSPYIFIVFLSAFVIYYIITNKTALGHNMRALGGNSELAVRAGLNVERIKQLSFTISGVFAGIAAAIYMSSSGQVNTPAAFASMGIIMDAFLGMFLGIFLSRYCNAAVSIVIAVITMTVLTNGLLTMGIEATYREIIKSAILFILLAFTANQPYFIRWRANLKRAEKANEEYREYQRSLTAQ